MELKASVPTPDVIAMQLASMGNTDGGTLLIGVQEPKSIVGINPKKADTYVHNAVQKLLHLKVIERGSVVIEGKYVYYVTVGKSESLVIPGAGYYKRVGSRAQPMTAQEIHALSIPRPALELQIASLSDLAQEQLRKIDDLSDKVTKANSWKKKVPAAFLGALLTLIVKLAFGGL